MPIIATLALAAPSSAPADAHYWIGQLRMPQAWALSTGAGVTVGVLDTGANVDHPNLAGAVRPGRAFPDLGEGVRDARGHGTAVAMLIAGRGRDGATKGIAPDAQILPVTTSGTSDTVNEAVRWLADQHVAVINMSFGRSRVTGRSAELFDDAIRYAADRDVVVVAAAGNSSEDTAVVTPANRPGVLAVSAVDRDNRFRPDVSVSGPEVALAAPGVAMVTAAEARIGERPLSPNGTSYSAALVSGVIALVRAKYPDLPAADVVRQVLATARPAGPDGRDAEYGYGIVDPVAALTATPTTASPAPAPAPGRPWWLVPALVVLPLGLTGTALAWWWRKRTR
jgi:type VII secretion-associated serine protease mycosin